MSTYSLSQLGNLTPCGGNREYPSYASNKTASYVPSQLLKAGSYREPTDKVQVFPTVDLALLESLEPAIKDHFERRLQLMAQQMLLVYKTGRQYEAEKAHCQVGKGKSGYAAAHNSTLPNLLCTQDEEKCFFGKGTPLYYPWNETTALPTLVNKMDTRLDLHHKKINAGKALRKVSVEVLNQLAATESAATPQQGLKAFVQNTASILDSAKQKTSVEMEKLVLGYYHNVAQSYAGLLDDDKTFKKLCLVPEWTQLNEEFFQDLQLYMYKTLLVPEDSSALATKLFTRRVVQIPTVVLAGKAAKYATSCQSVEAIRACAAKYLKETDSKIVQIDLELLKKLGNSRSVVNLGLSPLLKALYDEVLTSIRTALRTREPQNMGSILTWLVGHSLLKQ